MVRSKWGKVFIKAASQGSSVGCYSASNEADLVKGIADAFGYSEQVLIEKAVKPRELEVAVYQYGDELVATYPGEICVPQDKFYTYEEKYSSASHTATSLKAEGLTQAIRAALAEDLGRAGDITTYATIGPELTATAELNSREHGVVRGRHFYHEPLGMALTAPPGPGATGAAAMLPGCPGCCSSMTMRPALESSSSLKRSAWVPMTTSMVPAARPSLVAASSASGSALPCISSTSDWVA